MTAFRVYGEPKCVDQAHIGAEAGRGLIQNEDAARQSLAGAWSEKECSSENSAPKSVHVRRPGSRTIRLINVRPKLDGPPRWYLVLSDQR